METLTVPEKSNVVSLQPLKDRLSWPLFLMLIYPLCIYIVQPAFFSPSNLFSLLYYTCLLVPAVLGVQLLMLLGLFDLSVGAIAALSGIVVAKALSLGCSIMAAISIACGTGVLFGALNWVLVSKAGIAALIGTLISMGAARAAALGLSQGQVIGGLPNKFGNLVLSTPSSISPAVFFGLFLLLLIEFLSQKHVIFRRLYHVGSNREACAHSGINVLWLEGFGFVLCALGTALAGILQSSRTLSASPLIFSDLALECIAACVIGGTSLSGAKGRPIGAFLGMLMVVVSRNLAVLAGVGVYWKELAVAVVLLAAVLLNRSTNNN